LEFLGSKCQAYREQRAAGAKSGAALQSIGVGSGLQLKGSGVVCVHLRAKDICAGHFRTLWSRVERAWGLCGECEAGSEYEQQSEDLHR
jgi:hypothetical protein